MILISKCFAEFYKLYIVYKQSTWVVMSGGWERNITENNSGFRSTMTLRFTVPD